MVLKGQLLLGLAGAGRERAGLGRTGQRWGEPVRDRPATGQDQAWQDRAGPGRDQTGRDVSTPHRTLSDVPSSPGGSLGSATAG